MAPATPSAYSTDDEIDTYLLLPASNNSSDVLQFWIEQKTQLPKKADNCQTVTVSN